MHHLKQVRATWFMTLWRRGVRSGRVDVTCLLLSHRTSGSDTPQPNSQKLNTETDERLHQLASTTQSRTSQIDGFISVSDRLDTKEPVRCFSTALLLLFVFTLHQQFAPICIPGAICINKARLKHRTEETSAGTCIYTSRRKIRRQRRLKKRVAVTASLYNGAFCEIWGAGSSQAAD